MSNNPLGLVGVIVIKSGAKPRIAKRKDGTQVIFNEQKGAIEKGEDFPAPFTFNLQDGQMEYPPGRYVIDPACLLVGDFDALRFGRRLDLVRLPDTTSKA